MSVEEYIKGGSRLMKVTITLDSGQVYTVDLGKELLIFESRMTDSLKKAPSAYAFIASLFKDRAAKARRLERQLEVLEAQLVVHYCTNKLSDYYKKNNKLAAVNIAKYLARANPKYIRKHKEYEKTMKEKDKLEVAVKSFEQRTELIRSLNANARNRANA
jgi:hypothetical protein